MENTNTIYKKLLKVQEELRPIEKNEKNPYFNSKYFDINTLLKGLKPILTKNGLVLTQGIEANNDKNVLETVVTDSENGRSIVSHILLPEVSDPQKFGSVITYYRRYALQALFALEAADDDGNKASGKSDSAPLGKPFQPKRKPYQGVEHDERKDDAENDLHVEEI